MCSWLMTKLDNGPVATGLSLLISKGLACASPFPRLHHVSGVENLLYSAAHSFFLWTLGSGWSGSVAPAGCGPASSLRDIQLMSIRAWAASQLLLLLYSLCLQGTGDSHAWMAVRWERGRGRASSGEAQTHREVISECFGRKSGPSEVLPDLESSSTYHFIPFSERLLPRSGLALRVRFRKALGQSTSLPARG